MHNDLDNVLRMRAEPQARPHLAELIIANAKPRVARGKQSLLSLFQEIFVLPHPAVVLALVLLMGVSFGIYVDPAQASVDAHTQELSSFLKIKDSFDIGEWL